MLEIAVIDTGIGVSVEAQGRLFQHFEQGEVGMHRRYGGSGLGLAICRKIVTAMGGDIGVDSEQGRGSRFWFRIPLQRSTESRRALVQGENGPASVNTRLRILVAEDNQINQRVIRALLERMGHACQTVSNGLEAVRAVQDAPFDMLLMDVQMPEMDGVEATKAIRALGGVFLQLPIVAVTANVLPGDAARYVAQGMNGVLAKPIEPQALRAAVEGFALEGAGAPPTASVEDERLPSVEHLRQIDCAVIADMRAAVGDDVYLSLMQDLKRDVRRHLDLVGQGLASSDVEALRRGAHSLSSLLSTFGLNNAGVAFGRVEELIRAGKPAQAQTLGALLESETLPAMEDLERQIKMEEIRL
jgi:CheY-like chemotaxis protein